MIEVAEAEALIREHMPKLPPSREALVDCVGRVLAEDVRGERDQPPFDRVTMDGIAIAYRDFAAGTRGFEVVGTQAAGAAQDPRPPSGAGPIRTSPCPTAARARFTSSPGDSTNTRRTNSKSRGS